MGSPIAIERSNICAFCHSYGKWEETAARWPNSLQCLRCTAPQVDTIYCYRLEHLPRASYLEIKEPWPVIFLEPDQAAGWNDRPIRPARGMLINILSPLRGIGNVFVDANGDYEGEAIYKIVGRCRLSDEMAEVTLGGPPDPPHRWMLAYSHPKTQRREAHAAMQAKKEKQDDAV